MSVKENYHRKMQVFTKRQYLILLPIGLFILLLGVFLYFNTNKFVSRASATVGTVVDVRITTTPGELSQYTTTIEFVTGEGKIMHFVQLNSHTHMGDQVDVLYDPLNPSEASIHKFWQLWGWSVITISIGSFVSIWGVHLLLNQIRARKNGYF